MITFGSEPWWYSNFWRKSICILVPAWTLTFIYFSLDAFKIFKSYKEKVLGKIFCIRDEWWIIPEYLNHVKDEYYFLFKDHSNIFLFCFGYTILLPFVTTWGAGGPLAIKAIFGFGQDHPAYARARWMIKTRICFYENIP